MSEQDDGKVDNIKCESNFGCWGDGQCNEFLNTFKNCFDGGDCSKPEMRMSECNEINCCNGAGTNVESTLTPPLPFSDCGILKCKARPWVTSLKIGRDREHMTFLGIAS